MNAVWVSTGHKTGKFALLGLFIVREGASRGTWKRNSVTKPHRFTMSPPFLKTDDGGPNLCSINNKAGVPKVYFQVWGWLDQGEDPAIAIKKIRGLLNGPVSSE
jgi:hypothetical protein